MSCNGSEASPADATTQQQQGVKQVTHFNITGFGPFHGVAHNPTSDLIRHLPEYLKKHPLPPDVIVDNLRVLETSGVGSREAFHAMNHCPDALCAAANTATKSTDATPTTNGIKRHRVWLHFGVHAGSRQFKLESSAYNEAHFICPDERGWTPQHQRIEDGAPDAMCTSLDVVTLSKQLDRSGSSSPADAPSNNSSGWCCQVSNDPGRFICNLIFWTSLRRATKERAHSLFVHVPSHDVYNLDVQLEFARELLIAISNQLNSQ